MNNKMIRMTVRDLMPGDVLSGSGFRVKQFPYRGLRTPSGKMVVVGAYPNGEIKAHTWSARTTVTVSENIDGIRR